MRFGVCCSLDQAPTALAAGFDYVELPASEVFGKPDQTDWNRLDGINVEATNLFAPSYLKLVGPDIGDVREYAELVIPRAALAGVKVLVIGSGAARRSPAGYDLDAAEGDFLDSVARCGQIAEEHGILIAPESLVPAETNVGNYLGDLARMLRHRGVGYTADSYHVLNQPGAMPWEAAYWEAELPFEPAHVHFSATDRTWRIAEDENVPGFIGRLKALDYDSRVSLECHWGEFDEELPQALDQAKSAFGA